MKKFINLFIFDIIVFVGIFSFLGVDMCLGAEDLMEKAFTPAREYDTIVDMGNTKNAVGNDVFKDGVSVAVSFEKGKDLISVDKKPPLIVRITKFLLRITVVISITMVIYSGISYILQSTSGGDTKGSTKNIALIVGGLVLALMSLAIIQLINSFAGKSLTF